MEDMIAPYRKLYRVVEGRASRSEFWMFFLLAVILHVIPFVLLFGTIGGMSTMDPEQAAGMMAGLGVITVLMLVPLYVILLVTWLALAAVSIRRLHDVGLTGWIYVGLLVANFIPFVNFIGWIAYIVLMALPGTQGPNKYGPHPDHEDSAQVFA